MESSACPVCTLFLRQGISLEEHLETHPKDQVIEALVNSIRSRDTEPQHVTNGYAMQTLPVRSTQYYELPSQCLPLQPYQSNAIAYQQLLPNNSVPPISPSPYVPVTMFMAPNGTPNQPALMQMVCNPYNVMQIQQQQQQQQQQPVQIANHRSSGHTQQTSFPKPMVSPLSNPSSSSQHIHISSGIKAAHGVSSTGMSHSFSNSLCDNSDLQDGSANIEALQSPCSNPDTRLGSNRPTESPAHSLVNTEDLHPPTIIDLEVGNQSPMEVPKMLPMLRSPPTDGALLHPGLTNRVRVIRVLPPPENSCLDPKLRSSTSSLTGDTVPITFPRKVIGISHSTTETGERYKSLLPKSSLALQNLRSELRDLVTTYNSNDGSTVQEPEYIDLPPFENSSVDNVTYRLNFTRNTPTSSKTDVLNNELENLNSSSHQNSVNKVPERDCQVDKSPPLTLKPMDIELSRINLTDLVNKPCSSKPTGRIEASSNNPVHNFDELSNSAFLSPKSPTLRVRTDLNKIEHTDDEVSECQDEEVRLCVQQQSSKSPRPTPCPETFLEPIDSESNQRSNSPRRNQTSESRDSLQEALSLKLNNESVSCDSRSKSLSPGLRIRTDLSSITLGNDCLMNRRERHLKAQHLLSQLDSNEVTAVLGMVRSSLEIQLPPLPVGVPDNDEYITSDCNYNAEDESVNRLTDQGTSAADETKTDVSSPVKPKTLFSNFHRSNSSDEVVSFEPSSPVNIIEIDGIHIIVPRQFYEEQQEGQPGSVTPTSLTPSDQNDAHLEITPLQNVNLRADRRLPLREFSKKNDDTQVSTSYDLLARESWASDGSDTEINADYHLPAPAWDDAPDRRPLRYGKGKAGRVYKCITCGETFNCPKERRVHCSTHHSEKNAPIVIPVPPVEMVKSSEELREELRVGARKRHSVTKPTLKRVKKARKGCEVLFVRNEATSFMGVFVKDTGEENKMQSEGNDELGPLIDKVPLEASSELKREIKEVMDEKKDVKSIVGLKMEKNIPCMTCNELFLTKKHLQQHVRLVHKSGEWKHMCDCCQEVFTTELLYNQHLKVHPLECKQCSKNFYRRQNLLVHMKRHLGIKPHKCNMCEKAFVTKQKLSEHQNSHTGAAPIKCPLCPMSFRRYSNLIQHKNRLHYKIKKKIKDFVCFCGDIFHSRKKLDWHKEIHDEKPKCCPSCSERFVHAASLTRHIRRAHDRRYMPKVGRESENVECSICGHVFLKSSLPVHMRLHSGVKPYSCAVCGKNFATKWNLQQHRWVHASRSSKPFKCTLCKGAFAREADYTQHMDAHRNKRPYTCNVCGEQFVRKPNCLRHMKEHEAGKNFFCNECGKSFHRGYYLKDHMRVHTGVRPHVCHICGKASSTKSNHNKHVKIHHAREPVNTES